MVGTFHELLFGFAALLTLEMNFAQKGRLEPSQLVYSWLVLPTAVNSPLSGGGIQSATR